MDQENKTREENIEVHFTESEDEEILNGDSPNNDRPDRYDFADPKAIKKEIRKGLLASTEGYANAGLTDTELDIEGINGVKKHPLSPGLRMLVISVGFMTDAYDLFVIGIVLVIIRRLYGENTTAEALLATAVLIGTTIGQLFFGIMGDKISRRKMFFITLIIITVMAFLCALAFPANQYIYLTLGLFRTILGFGIGGEYPLSATLAAEGATDPATRGRTMAIVFAMQGFGYLLAPLVVLLLVGLHVPEEYIWRITLGFGGIPGLLTLYHRLKLEDSVQFQRSQSMKPSAKATAKLIFREYKWVLLGTAGTWFLFDITFYGNGLFKETVFIILGLSGQGSDEDKLFRTAVSSLIIAVLSIPGYWVSVFLIDKWGRKPIQFLGFAAITVLFLLMSLLYKQLIEIGWLFIIVYALTFFFSNFGPNTTTYVVASEAYPTDRKSVV